MSKIELFILIVAASIPFFALIFVLPKNFKKKSKEKKSTKKTSVIKPTIEQPKEPEEIKPEYINNSNFSTDDFKSYLTHRPEISKPKRKELDDGFVDRTMPYIPRRPQRIQKEYKQKNISEEIKSLSPELKALIISGFLNRKY